MDTKTTRLPVDLIEAAEAEGREERRSAAKQLEHWARFGMFFDRQTSASRRRIQRAIAGEISLGDLDDHERVVANAAMNAAISTAANEVSFADRLAARGVTTVVMDDEGRMVRRHPDGSTTIL
jgi:ParD-like antitoxin of type II bacterial toxin-antitoxin system